MRVRIYTKTPHITKIVPILASYNISYEIFTVNNVELENNYITSIYDEKSFDLGISYAYSRKILPPLLTAPRRWGFINFHAAPLPEYPGGDPYSKGIENKVKRWGVTCHKMTEEYDEGKIIAKWYYDTQATNRTELGMEAYTELLKLFKFVLGMFFVESKNKVRSLRKEE